MKKINNDGTINGNYVATEATKLEGKQVSINVAQMKEALKCICIVLTKEFPGVSYQEFIERIGE